MAFAILFVAIAAFFFSLAGESWTRGSGWSGIPGRRLYVVTSGSMSPTFRIGDAVVVKPLNDTTTRTLGVGKVVTFRAANNPAFLITHRIVAVKSSAGGKRYYETKGDANESPDETPLDPSRIVGTVTRVVPRLGAVLVALHTPRILMTFFVGFLLVELAIVAFRLAAARDEVVSEESTRV